MSANENYIEVSFEVQTNEQSEICMALLIAENYEGFEELPRRLTAFIPEHQFNLDALQQIAKKTGAAFHVNVIPPKNWNELWESNFQPVRINDYCLIRAPFHEPAPDVQYELVIMPKMSFGTGHHATTYMMVEQMQELDLTGKTVLDFGTGTGILAILAEKSGAADIAAIDNEARSIENAFENAERNNCSKVVFTLADQLNMPEKFDVIFANINKNVILNHMESVIHHLKSKGKVVFSGLLSGDETEIRAKAELCGLAFEKRLEKNHWISLRFGKI